MDSLIIERNGKYETWYSDEYVKQQMESAYRSGLHKGMRLQFHAIEPQRSECVERLVNEVKVLPFLNVPDVKVKSVKPVVLNLFTPYGFV